MERRHNPDIPAEQERSVDADKKLRAHLERHRLTYRRFAKALMQVGVSVEKSRGGSGHLILRYPGGDGSDRVEAQEEDGDVAAGKRDDDHQAPGDPGPEIPPGDWRVRGEGIIKSC
jgi:hypothetical protein